ncbi:MAG: DUF427 domain-containing protein [Actinobacteria bacterium]|nr:DUF427 domain-containing protein [Actinomycetota bacterium]
MKPTPVPPGPGQESVWDYPRPPRVEPVRRQCEVIFGGQTIAITLAPVRALETSHPPVYYFPPDSVLAGAIAPTERTSYCEWKGIATYLDVVRADEEAPAAAWTYRDPKPGYEILRDHIAFYPQLMEVCLVDGEYVRPQPGGFYGGWITMDVVGPFKGVPGSDGW